MKTLLRPLQGQLVQLRVLTPDAVSAEYLRWMQDPEVLRFLEARHLTFTLEGLRQYVAARYAEADSLMLGIYWNANDRHIGNIKLSPIDYKVATAEMGILIGDKSYWGKGAAPEAIQLLTDYALGDLGLKTVTAGCFSANVGSQKAFAKAGFQSHLTTPELIRMHRRL